MNKHSHFTDYFSIQTSPEALQCQSYGCKGWALYITMITASYWPLIAFFWGIRYRRGTPQKREMFDLLCISRIFRSSERRSKETQDRTYQVYRKGLPTSGRLRVFKDPPPSPCG
jgi:hypothetical protein